MKTTGASSDTNLVHSKLGAAYGNGVRQRLRAGIKTRQTRDQLSTAAQSLAPVPSTLVSREFSLTAGDFGRIRDLIYRRVDISLSDRKSEMVCSRLARRLRVVNSGSLRDCLDALEKGHLPDEREAFTNALATNLTVFFRGQHHFPVLYEHTKAKRTPFTMWCSASSAGEKPYPIAITLAEVFGSMSPSQVGVIASGVDTNVLARVRAGIYPMECVVALSPERLKKHSLRDTGKQEGYARVRPELQAMIGLRQTDLLERGWPLQQKSDVIFYRNVMIYLDKPTQAKILEHLIDVMKSDGLLLASHSESFLQVTKVWSLRGETMYKVAPGLRARVGAR